MTHRIARVSQAIRGAIAELLQQGAIRDPRVTGGGLISVTEVRVSPDLRHARVYVSIFADDSAREAALLGLRHAAGFLRREVGHAIQLRSAPILDFELDGSIEQGARIEGILRELKTGG